jgi:hypothetical protein
VVEAAPGQGHVGLVERALLQAQVGDHDAVAGQGAGDLRGEVAASGDHDLAAGALGAGDAGQIQQVVQVDLAERAEAQALVLVAGRDQPGRGVGGHEPAPVEDGDPVAQLLDLVHEVADQHDGDAVVADPLDRRPGGPPRPRVQAGGELVEERDLGPADQGQGDEQALLLAAGQLAEAAAGQPGEIPALGVLGRVGRVGVEGGVQVERLADLHRLGQGRLLELDADPLAQAAGAVGGVEPEDAGAAAVRAAQPLQDLDRRGLAGPVGAEDAEDLPPLDLEADPGERDLLAVALGEVPGLDDRHGDSPIQW